MRRFTIATIAAATLLASCGKKGVETPPDTPSTDPTSDIMPSSSELSLMDTLRFGESTFVVQLSRHIDTTLPTVRDANGTEFFDNRVDIQVVRNGVQVAEKMFTKADFDQYLSEADRRESVLQGMAIVTDECSAQVLRFAAQIGEPGADGEGPAFRISLNPVSGSTSIARDLSQDTPRDDMMGDEGED